MGAAFTSFGEFVNKRGLPHYGLFLKGAAFIWKSPGNWYAGVKASIVGTRRLFERRYEVPAHTYMRAAVAAGGMLAKGYSEADVREVYTYLLANPGSDVSVIGPKGGSEGMGIYEKYAMEIGANYLPSEGWTKEKNRAYIEGIIERGMWYCSQGDLIHP
ncbi:hypothetical protein STHERM_c00690 [Spirochaeta thermophila DSM 6192]|uniref:Uncharacterized protein n=1 Tax=Winmispira thermophila (strain ATCC 49972 / DSM 6192 / RI 19.B1) TaxID=665571 RepID=E0RTY9_WINT6|nr:hypothetical protein STHERM_c00690 [Spirochaeta thermophila DSM 6192]